MTATASDTMVFKATDIEQLAWYQQLYAILSPKGSHQGRGHSLPKEGRRRNFEIMDEMEQGISNELTARYIEVPKGDAEQRLLVHYSKDDREIILMSRNQEPLLVAYANSEGTGFDFYVPRGEQPYAAGPVFILRYTTPARWTLTCHKCENCEWKGKRQNGTRTLANICHYSEEIGILQTFCMDLEIPEVGEDTSTAIWCPVCGDYGQQQKAELTTRRPTWIASEQRLMMNFKNRCAMASARNFQIEMPGRPEEFCLLYGKKEHLQFVLDFKAPLSMVQAFATALTTNWQPR